MNACEHVRTRFYPLAVSTVTYASDSLCLYTLALQCARRAGVPQQLHEDCAQDFLLHFLTLCSRSEIRQESEHRTILTRAWLNRSAYNHAIDFLRHQSFLSQHETEMPQGENGEDHFLSPQPTPEAQALAEECRKRIQEVVVCLTPAQQDLFTRLIVNGDSAGEVAEATGRTAHAIRQAHSTLCKQLRKLFARRGITEEDLREYISLMQNGGGRNKLNLIARFSGKPKNCFSACLKSPLTFSHSKSLKHMRANTTTPLHCICQRSCCDFLSTFIVFGQERSLYEDQAEAAVRSVLAVRRVSPSLPEQQQQGVNM